MQRARWGEVPLKAYIQVLRFDRFQIWVATRSSSVTDVGGIFNIVNIRIQGKEGRIAERLCISNQCQQIFLNVIKQNYAWKNVCSVCGDTAFHAFTWGI